MKTQKPKAPKTLRRIPDKALANVGGGYFLFCTPTSDPISYDCTNMGDIFWVNYHLF